MITNIFKSLPAVTKTAAVSTIAQNRNIKAELVVARGQISKADTFCAQLDNDFLILLQGNLGIEYENGRKVSLAPGDYIFTGPKENNRISETSTEEEAIWLKFSFHGQVGQGAFPSPDLRKIKDRIKSNAYRNTAMIESLVESPNVRIERVVSIGEISPAGSCEQDFSEFIYVLKGETVLDIGKERVKLGVGDYTIIPPKVPTRVARTLENSKTIWLAVYFTGETGKKTYPFQTGYTAKK